MMEQFIFDCVKLNWFGIQKLGNPLAGRKTAEQPSAMTSGRHHDDHLSKISINQSWPVVIRGLEYLRTWGFEDLGLEDLRTWGLEDLRTCRLDDWWLEPFHRTAVCPHKGVRRIKMNINIHINLYFNIIISVLKLLSLFVFCCSWLWSNCSCRYLCSWMSSFGWSIALWNYATSKKNKK